MRTNSRDAVLLSSFNCVDPVEEAVRETRNGMRSRSSRKARQVVLLNAVGWQARASVTERSGPQQADSPGWLTFAIELRFLLPRWHFAIAATRWLLEPAARLRPLIGMTALAGMAGLSLPILVALTVAMAFVLVRHGFSPLSGRVNGQRH